jgi:general secretion pathway protein G
MKKMKILPFAMTILCLFQLACFGTHRDESSLRKDLMDIREAIDNYVKKEGHSPKSLEEIVSHHYLERMPIDPFTNSNSTWVAEFEGGRVVDVHSGSTASPKSGKPYRNW